jgi:RHS repeat-associated protein
VGIRGTNRSYYLFDGLGSVVAVTNANGGVTNSYTYDPYGVTTETKALLTNVFNPWRYAGQYQDVSTGLYKMGARYYQPELGRWTQRDPSGLDANAYAYVGGNPVNFTDPSGMFLDKIVEGIDAFDTFMDLVESGSLKEGLRPFVDDLAGVAFGVFTTATCEFVLGLLGIPTAGILSIIGSGLCATLGAAVGEVVQQSIGNG